jgi:hypothetical protein
MVITENNLVMKQAMLVIACLTTRQIKENTMTKWLVTTKHPNGWQDGTHVFETREYPDRPGKPMLYYANASHFGCSKNYPTEGAAIMGMCADHACQVLKIEEIDDDVS